MTTRQTMTISLPAEMMREVDRTSKKEGRTRSELIREALRHYYARDRVPVHQPTKRELRELKKGRQVMRRGAYFTLDEFRSWLMASPHQKTRRKKPSARAKA